MRAFELRLVRSTWWAACILAACTAGRAGTRGRDAGIDAGPSDPDTGPPLCVGCVDPESGACLLGEEDHACGNAGVPCAACARDRLCVFGSCQPRPSCTPDDCAGCCVGAVCEEGSATIACGALGAACTVCEADQACVDNTCAAPPACGPASCAGCCAADGTCAPGDAPSACGGAGAACEACAEGWTCAGGTCVAPCEQTCDGCCDASGVCHPGDADAQCGAFGRGCAACALSARCSDGVCIDDACADTCGGCCSGATCLPGDETAACGRAASACIDCGGSFTCADATCVVDRGSRWGLFVRSASFGALDPNGVGWDLAAGPDPFVTAEVTSMSGTRTSGETTRRDDTTNPSWNELVLADVAARDLIRGVTLRVFDYDDGGANDDIGFCYFVPTDAEFAVGAARLTCPARTSAPATVPIELRLLLQLR